MGDNVTALPGMTPAYREREPNRELIAYLEGVLQRAREGDTMAAVVCEQRFDDDGLRWQIHGTLRITTAIGMVHRLAYELSEVAAREP